VSNRDSRDEVRRELSYDDTMSTSQAAFEADLSAVHADDALLDALGGSDPKSADDLGDQELNALLLAWRRDIDSEPLAELVDTDTAATTVKAAALAQRRGPRARKRRIFVPVAAAAAVLAIAFTGTSIAARDAQPGDTLWGLTKVLYADHARSVEAASAARTDLQQASIALSQGRIVEAQQALAEAAAKLTQVSVEDNLAQLMREHRELTAKLERPTHTTPPTSSTVASSPATTTVPPRSSSPTTTSQSATSTAPTSSTTPSQASTTSSPPTSSSTAVGSSPGTNTNSGTLRDDTTAAKSQGTAATSGN
jgi:Anti-sigma-D factor RsdA to sigma factor binding region